MLKLPQINLTNWISLHRKPVIFLSLGLFIILTFGSLVVWFSNSPTSPKTWVISQDLYAKLVMRQTIINESQNNPIDLAMGVRAAGTESAIPNQIVQTEGNKILLETGSLGQVVADLGYGAYEVKMIPIPGVNFTNVPSEVKIITPIQQQVIGIAPGSGLVLGQGGVHLNLFNKTEAKNEQGKIIFKFFNDKNGNGKQEPSENFLEWAGIIVNLTKR